MPGASLLRAAGSTMRTEVPIVPHRLSNGDRRFAVSVQVGGGAPIEAMLDTGSFGLRIMARALAPAQYQPTGFVRGYGYGSGVVLHGPLAKAAVSIGGATGAPIAIQVVESISCNDRKPDCPASRLTPAEYGIGGDGLRGEGFDAILGLSLHWSDAPAAANNPLSAMGYRRWIITLPQPGDSAPGRLVINPDAGELAGFHPVWLRSRSLGADGMPQVGDLAIPSCPERPLDEQPSCPPMTLDSGSRSGVRPFYAYAVLFDAENKAIAVKRR